MMTISKVLGEWILKARRRARNMEETQGDDE
jgi:hypothetical protein